MGAGGEKRVSFTLHRDLLEEKGEIFFFFPLESKMLIKDSRKGFVCMALSFSSLKVNALAG